MDELVHTEFCFRNLHDLQRKVRVHGKCPDLGQKSAEMRCEGVSRGADGETEEICRPECVPEIQEFLVNGQSLREQIIGDLSRRRLIKDESELSQKIAFERGIYHNHPPKGQGQAI